MSPPPGEEPPTLTAGATQVKWARERRRVPLCQPLCSRWARVGAGPLLDTLHAYSASGAVATESAKRLHVSVRTVTYRLERVRTLTGYDAAEPAHRFTLQAAVLGAKVLNWPQEELPGPG